MDSLKLFLDWLFNVLWSVIIPLIFVISLKILVAKRRAFELHANTPGCRVTVENKVGEIVTKQCGSKKKETFSESVWETKFLCVILQISS